MKPRYHRMITVEALSPFFSEPALAEIVKANLRQDRLRNQFGHDEIHFDGSAFEAGFAYIQKQKSDLLEKVRQKDFSSARHAFGRITHAWQDYYSHSNYVQLWLAAHPNQPPSSIDPADPTLMAHKDLKSGKNISLFEFIAMIPGLSSLIVPRLPEDSHARMNLDSPAAGPAFVFNYQAARKRTILAYQDLQEAFELHRITHENLLTGFHGKAS